MDRGSEHTNADCQAARARPWRAWCERILPLGVLALVLSAAAVAEAGAADGETSCEADLTCVSQTKAVKPKLSQGPDLASWHRVDIPAAYASVAARTGSPPASVRDAITGMELVLIPGACYRPAATEHAPKQVCLDHIGAYEVTFDQYDQFARATGRKLPDDEGWGRGHRPVIDVNVYDALNFAKWLSRKTGAHFRLPTEVEWEHAARAGSMTRYPWGDDIGINRANCDGCGSRWDDAQTAPVGSFPPNAWGLHDVIGNVGEWTCSMRNPDHAHSFERCDSIYETRRRAYRNGAWSDEPDRLASAFRDWNAAIRRTDDVGFRLVRECKECDKTSVAPDAPTVVAKGADAGAM